MGQRLAIRRWEIFTSRCLWPRAVSETDRGNAEHAHATTPDAQPYHVDGEWLASPPDADDTQPEFSCGGPAAATSAVHVTREWCPLVVFCGLKSTFDPLSLAATSERQEGVYRESRGMALEAKFQQGGGQFESRWRRRN